MDKKSYVNDEMKSKSGSDRRETLIGLMRIGERDHDDHADDIDEQKEHHSSPNLKGDYGSICILLFLYVLQGIPLGLAAAIPMILQNRGVSYSEQAMFSLGNWPFSVKLLWAPLVDAMFWSRFGRRKSWLVPAQYMIGFTLIMASPYIDGLMGGHEQIQVNPLDSTASPPVYRHPAIYTLTALFLFVNFLCATQDIAVDGWALTMLSRRNVIYASTCNTVGQTAGYFMGQVVLLAFESADFCNRYFRSTPKADGLITLSGFLYFWGIVFVSLRH
jgi:PAT family acetyl-CoA transporter-like MFS transporter 1